jgi:hypothetical protein
MTACTCWCCCWDRSRGGGGPSGPALKGLYSPPPSCAGGGMRTLAMGLWCCMLAYCCSRRGSRRKPLQHSGEDVVQTERSWCRSFSQLDDARTACSAGHDTHRVCCWVRGVLAPFDGCLHGRRHARVPQSCQVALQGGSTLERLLDGGERRHRAGKAACTLRGQLCTQSGASSSRTTGLTQVRLPMPWRPCTMCDGSEALLCRSWGLASGPPWPPNASAGSSVMLRWRCMRVAA